MDYQIAKGSPRTKNSSLDCGPNIDVLAVSAVGIDERLTRETLEVAGTSSSHQVNHVSLNQIADQ